MIRREEGSVLVVTLAFMLVFTLLGFWSIHYSFTQSEIAEKEKASAEAFWMADGAIEREYKDLLATNFNTEPYSVVPKDDAPDGYLGDYNYYSYVESCPPPICGPLARSNDPTLPVCTDAERLEDPILCTDAERFLDPLLCTDAQRALDVPVCTAEERVDGEGLCPCEVTNSCYYRCPCEITDTCVGARCPCEIAGTCDGRCPCEVDDPPTCPCHLTDPQTCQPNMVGRCPCEWDGTTCCESWIIHSYGTVNDQSRTIEAQVGLFQGDNNINDALETWGDVNRLRDCEPTGSSEIEGGCEQQQDFTFETVFNKPQSWFYDPANYTHWYTNPPNNFEGVVEGITIIELTGNNKSVNISEDKQAYDADGVPIASLLIIDTTGVNEDKQDNIMITIAGNGVFRGILWIIGEASIVGGSNIYGAVFVAGDDGEVTKVSGNSEIHYSSEAITEALGMFDDELSNDPRFGTFTINEWKEINLSEY